MLFLSQYLNIATISLSSGFDATNIFRRRAAKITFKISSYFIIALNIEHEQYHVHVKYIGPCDALYVNDSRSVCDSLQKLMIKYINNLKDWKIFTKGRRVAHQTRLKHSMTVDVWITPTYAAVIHVQHATLVVR